jgi:hypothetical protein
VKKLSKEQSKALEDLKAKFERDRQRMTDAIVAYNSVVDEINTWIEEVHAEQENYYDERSEKWQEGDAGQAYQSWMQLFEEQLDQVDEPDETCEALEALTEEPEA